MGYNAQVSACVHVSSELAAWLRAQHMVAKGDTPKLLLVFIQGGQKPS